MADKKKTTKQFYADVVKIGLNAKIVFWAGYTLRRYQEDLITYEEALDTLRGYKNYIGSYQTESERMINTLIGDLEMTVKDE